MSRTNLASNMPRRRPASASSGERVAGERRALRGLMCVMMGRQWSKGRTFPYSGEASAIGLQEHNSLQNRPALLILRKLAHYCEQKRRKSSAKVTCCSCKRNTEKACNMRIRYRAAVRRDVTVFRCSDVTKSAFVQRRISDLRRKIF